jgi:hypothetical protein
VALTLVPTRGMGVLRVVMGDLRLGWDSPVREVVHPKYVNLTARGGLGWLEGFNEWLARCGLEWAGHPGRDMFVNNLGEQAEMDLTLHGKIANIPASEVEVIVDRDPRPRIRVRGRVDERAFYGPKLDCGRRSPLSRAARPSGSKTRWRTAAPTIRSSRSSTTPTTGHQFLAQARASSRPSGR